MEKLYPVNYDETRDAVAVAHKPGWEVPTARDTELALDIIRAAVPKGGKPLSPDQLVALVCGRYVRDPGGAHLPMADAPDASLDLPAALAALAAGLPLRGPTACASMTDEVVTALVAQVADERRGTWKLKEVAVVEAVLAVEEKPE